MTAAETLTRARDLLFNEDWSPTARRGPRGPRCVFWAIIDAEDVVASGLHRPALSYFKQVIGTDDVPGWNDTPGRTFGEVVDALDRAIKTAETDEIVA